MRAIHVVSGVFLAQPGQLDRIVDLRSDGHGLVDEVHLQSPTEGAADELVVDDDLLCRPAGGLGCCRLCAYRHLRSDPELHGIRANLGHTGHGLQRRVGEEGHLVFGFEGLRCVLQRLLDIAPFAGKSAGLVQRFLDLALHLRGVDGGVVAIIPLDFQGAYAGEGRPGVLAYDCHGIAQADHIDHARDFPRSAIIHTANGAADNRAGAR